MPLIKDAHLISMLKKWHEHWRVFYCLNKWNVVCGCITRLFWEQSTCVFHPKMHMKKHSSNNYKEVLQFLKILSYCKTNPFTRKPPWSASCCGSDSQADCAGWRGHCHFKWMTLPNQCSQCPCRTHNIDKGSGNTHLSICSYISRMNGKMQSLKKRCSRAISWGIQVITNTDMAGERTGPL